MLVRGGDVGVQTEQRESVSAGRVAKRLRQRTTAIGRLEERRTSFVYTDETTEQVRQDKRPCMMIGFRFLNVYVFG